MIRFRKETAFIILVYESDQTSNEWIYRELKEKNNVNLKHTFHLTKDDLFGDSTTPNYDEDTPVEFKIAVKVGGYYQFSKDILFLDNELFIHENIELKLKVFTAEKNVSVFSKFDEIANESIYIGGNNENCIPKNDFDALIKNFPNSYELKRYVLARVSALVRTYLDTKIDGEEKYQKYMNKKRGKAGNDLRNYFSEFEAYKYTELYSKLESMLTDENSYNESQWQEEILQIILLIYPKYIQVFKEAPVRDSYNKKNRKIDLLLVDASGNTDIIEIKKPFGKCIVTNNTYRDNYIPLRELSGTVMQIEKYIFYLNKWGMRGEDTLTKRYEKELPEGFSLKVTNPHGIIIMGRSCNLSVAQKQDFEVIKRKYKHVIDILTYDDLLSRLKFMIEQWKKNI